MERNELAMLVAHNIQSAMARQGLNPAELARKAKINATGVYDILSGKSQSPRLDTIYKIARALHVPMSYLLEEATEADLRAQIIEAIERLPEGERRRILTTARAWAVDQ